MSRERENMKKLMTIFTLCFASTSAWALTTINVAAGQSIDISAGDNLRVQCGGNTNSETARFCGCYNGGELWIATTIVSTGESKWTKLVTLANEEACKQAMATNAICR